MFDFSGALQGTIISSRQVSAEERRRFVDGGFKKGRILSTREQLFLILVRLRRGIDE